MYFLEIAELEAFLLEKATKIEDGAGQRIEKRSTEREDWPTERRDQRKRGEPGDQLGLEKIGLIEKKRTKREDNRWPRRGKDWQTSQKTKRDDGASKRKEEKTTGDQPKKKTGERGKKNLREKKNKKRVNDWVKDAKELDRTVQMIKKRGTKRENRHTGHKQNGWPSKKPPLSPLSASITLEFLVGYSSRKLSFYYFF